MSIRNKEFIWLIKHPKELEKYAGQYIAISNQKIIAHSHDFTEVFFKAKKKAEQEPLFHKVDRKNEEVIL